MNKKKIMIAYLSTALTIGIALAIWRTVLMVQYYDPFNYKFIEDAEKHLSAFGYVTLSAVLIMMTSYFFVRKQSFAPFSITSNQMSIFSAFLCGFIFLAIGIFLLIYFPCDIFKSGDVSLHSVLQIFSFFTLFLASGYFVFSASREQSKGKLKKVLCFFPSLWTLIYLITSYVNPQYQYNDSNRILCHVSLIALLLFFLQETRSNVSVPQAPFHFAISLVTLVCAMAYTLPMFFLIGFWEVPMTSNTMFELVECGAICYIFSVPYTMIRSVKEQSSSASEPCREPEDLQNP